MAEKSEPLEPEEDEPEEQESKDRELYDKQIEPYEFPPERPLECSECKKPVAVQYTGIIGKNIVHTLMCADCPFLQQHLQGIPVHQNTNAPGSPGTGLCCGNCGTTLESVRMGNTVGCSECYEVFGDVLVTELQSSSKLPPHIVPTNKKSFTLHLGRGPGETNELNPSLKLLALNEALSETLKLEDYEQAAWLRDQIKEISQKITHHQRQEKNGNKQSGQGDKEKGADER